MRKDNLMDYKSKLGEAKEYYPFKKWRTFFDDGLEQYTEKTCSKSELIMDTLMSELLSMGENAPEEEKMKKFQVAVEAFNILDSEVSGLIETGEREDLCELFFMLAKKAGIDPTKYGDGEGPASEWREW